MVDSKEEKKLTINDIEIYIPNEQNINYHWERIIKLWVFVYGIIIRKKDNKMLVTYNINPDDIHKDHFTLIDKTILPSKVYELLKKKVLSDIARIDNMMYNLVKNKWLLNTFISFTENNEWKWLDVDYDVFEYSEEDARLDKEIEQTKMLNRRTMRRNPSAQKKALRKLKKKNSKRKWKWKK